jgi:hypothetical protein
MSITGQVAEPDRVRAAVVAGLCVPAVLSLLVLVVTRLALPPEAVASANDPQLHTFFGLACLPFTAIGAFTLWTHPIVSASKRALAWLSVGLALLAALYAFGGWRLMPSAPDAKTSSAPTPLASTVIKRA